jgi:hypothetical protein
MPHSLLEFPCSNCGAHVSIDGSTQTSTCPYCQNQTLLPLEIWQRFHPEPIPVEPPAPTPPPVASKFGLVVGIIGAVIGVTVAIGVALTGTVAGSVVSIPSIPAMGTASSLQAYASPGDACQGRRAACSTDKTADLVCGPYGKFVVSSTCKGPGGCFPKADGKTITCDTTFADPKDPCSVDDSACSTDHKAEVRCVGGHFKVTATCKGPSGCTVVDKNGGKTLSCDDHIADVGDPCFDSDRTACGSNGKDYLTCVGQKFAVAHRCTGPAGCKATHIAGTGKTQMDCDHPR